MKKLLIVGNGIATGSLLLELLQLGATKYDITVFGDEATPAYNRVLLSNVLAGEQTPENISLQTEDWYQEHNIKRRLGTRIVSINAKEQTITCHRGKSYSYDELVLSTGANARTLDIKGKELEGVMSFRSLADAEKLQQIAHTAKRTIVLGGGLLGLEAAAGLANHGTEVTVIHRNNYLMNRQLDACAAELLQTELESKGVSFRLGRTPLAINGASQVEGVGLDNGESINAECVVQAAGITPNISLAQISGIPCSQGILVNDYLETSVDAVYALGECCEHQNQTVGLVAPIRDHAKVLARVLHDDRTLAYQPKPTCTQLKISGIQLFSAGQLMAKDKPTEEISLRVPACSDLYSNSYRKILIRNNQLTGVVLFGDTSDSQWYFEKLQAGSDISDVRENLLFGQKFCA